MTNDARPAGNTRRLWRRFERLIMPLDDSISEFAAANDRLESLVIQLAERRGRDDVAARLKADREKRLGTDRQ